MKKNSGITLLALIITIIIMLILAGVTISIVGGSDGIVAKAEKAVRQTDKAAMQEDAELSIAAIKMDYYENYAANRANYGNAKAFILAELEDEYTTSRGATMVADSEGNVTYTYKGVATEVTLTDDGSVSFGESSGAVSNVGEIYYGDASIVPTNQKYFTFSINEDGKTVTITGVKDEYAVNAYYYTATFNCAINDNGTYITEIAIPYQYIDENGITYMVTSIADSAFGPEDDILIGRFEIAEYMFTKITIPNTVIRIGSLAFAEQRKLNNINIPSGVTSIEDDVFSCCTSLSSINIPESVTSIGQDAFYRCTSLSSITIPESVTTIGDRGFFSCTSLSSVSMPSVTTIGDYGFYSCTNLSNVSMPNVTSIGQDAFSDCTSLSSVSMPSVTTIERSVFYRCTSLSSVSMPNVTSIGQDAFGGCTSLSSVSMPNVTDIGDRAFYICTSLSSIEIPASVTSIAASVFYECTNLTTVTIDSSTIASGLTSEIDQGYLLQNATTIYIKSGLTARLICNK